LHYALETIYHERFAVSFLYTFFGGCGDILASEEEEEAFCCCLLLFKYSFGDMRYILRNIVSAVS
jgi:hypothetical protein